MQVYNLSLLFLAPALCCLVGMDLRLLSLNICLSEVGCHSSCILVEICSKCEVLILDVFLCVLNMPSTYGLLPCFLTRGDFSWLCLYVLVV